MDIYRDVTERILQERERGIIPWKKPWIGISGAYNRMTKKRYSLTNQIILKHSGEYATFQQWINAGGKIKRGAKSEIIIFWKFEEETVTNKEEEELEEKKVRRPILRYYHVFHISQVEGLDPVICPNLSEEKVKKDENAEKLLQDYVMREGIMVEKEFSNQAFYSLECDKIHVPLIKQFTDISEYYSTFFHEVVHSSGHKKRLNRKGLQSARFGSAEYSKEELIAEIGGEFILHYLGINTELSTKNSTAYLQSWMKVLKGDKRLFLTAAGQAEKAVNFILGKLSR